MLGIGLVVAQDASANHGGPHNRDRNNFSNVFAQVNVADVTQVNNVAQDADQDQTFVAAQSAECTTGNRNNECNTTQLINVEDVDLDQEIEDNDGR